MRKAFGKFSLVNSDEERVLIKYERFVWRTHCFYSKQRCNENTPNGKHDVKRAIIIFIMKLCSFTFLIRCILWPTPFIKYWTCNAYHYLGNAIFISLVMFAATMSGNIGMGLFFTGNSLVHRSPFLVYFDKFQHKKHSYYLNERNRHKFFQRLNLFAKWLNAIHIPTVISWSCLISGPVIMGYFDPDLQFSLISKNWCCYNKIHKRNLKAYEQSRKV